MAPAAAEEYDSRWPAGTCQNVYLYAAAHGLAKVIRAWIDRDAIAEALGRHTISRCCSHRPSDIREHRSPMPAIANLAGSKHLRRRLLELTSHPCVVRHIDQVERRLVNEILIAGHPPRVCRRHEREGVLGRMV